MFRQTIMTLDRVDISEELKMDCMFQVAEQVRIADPDKTPAHITTFIYRKIMEYAKNDPYRIVKLQYNKIAMGLMPELSKLINDSHDPLWTASRIAIAGNIIDFGLFKEFDIGAIIKRSLQPKIAVDEYQRFKEYINNNKKILYLLDNSGEVVFDMMLIKVLIEMGKDVTAIVKGKPIINDVTMEDAMQIGLTDICSVIDNGSDAVGTIREWCSPEFIHLYNNAPLIISKGQGNFETLHQDNTKILFLFQSKCDVISRWLNLEKGSMLLGSKTFESLNN
ncbi:MAG: DUF89 family protein [Nitrospirae bacterium]|nr:DUF89 family protein [Nitrospirota bacterium]